MSRTSRIQLTRPLFETHLGLRVLYCGRFRCRPDWAIKSIRFPVEMIGFFFVEKNHCWAVVNGRHLVLKQGDLLVLHGRDELTMGHDPAAPNTALSISLALKQGPVANTLLQRKFARRHRISNPREYVIRFDAILAGLASPLGIRDAMAAGALLQWIAYVLEETKAPLETRMSVEGNVVDKVLASQAWVMARLGKVVILEEWSREMGWHPVYFERVFKRETGLTPMRWLKERRMDAARQYLSGTAQTVTEIARAVGYADPFYFSRVYKMHFGRSPLRHRKSGMDFLGG